MLQLLRNLHKEEYGQDLVEYVIVASLVSVAAMAGSSTLVTALNAEWGIIAGKIT